MKKRAIMILSILILTTILSTLSACTVHIDNQDIMSTIKDAIQNSLEEEFYYYKETILTETTSSTLAVNLHGDKDKKFNTIKENDLIKNYRLSVRWVEPGKTKDRELLTIYCGKTSTKDGQHEGNYLLTTSEANPEKVATAMSTEEYVNSAEFEQYTLAKKLKELSLLEAQDINIISAKQQYKVIFINFTVTEEYLTSYAEQNGTKSIFAGAKRVELEITYDRIAAITTYAMMYDNVAKIEIEKEPYKNYITYYGPKINIPKIKDPTSWNTDKEQ